MVGRPFSCRGGSVTSSRPLVYDRKNRQILAFHQAVIWWVVLTCRGGSVTSSGPVVYDRKNRKILAFHQVVVWLVVLYLVVAAP